MEAWQLPASATASAASLPRITGCSSFTLPANGLLSLPNGDVITLSADAVFKPACSAAAVLPAIITNGGITADEGSPNDLQVSDLRDPFYASTFPQCYALAATTVIAYTLVIMLLIAPRSFLDGGVVVLGRRGFTNPPTNGISIGGRPWLQKVAALTVAVSLTIATADTFRVAEDQYKFGSQNAQTLQQEVLGGTQLKSIRLISDTFLWLAQAQTLIRLFPRQREKVIIKWTAFALITLDVIFGALNSFQYTGVNNTRPRSFTDAVPALSYLFQLSLGLLYAAWVIYYSLMKKRYAFYHPLMKNICLVSMLSILAIIVPVVFFILDISKPEFTGWGDYVRWVGAAAASVIVWEWVERIEALEREEKKDGILGREVFDGDEMLDMPPSDFILRRRKRRPDDDESGGSGEDGALKAEPSPSALSGRWPAMSTIASRYIPKAEEHNDYSEQRSGGPAAAGGRSASRFLQPPLWPSRPAPAATPISRTDTASADSTVYAVRYQPVADTNSRSATDRLGRPLSRTNSHMSSTTEARAEPGGRSSSPLAPRAQSPDCAAPATSEQSRGGWARLTRILRARSEANQPPAEVLPHTQRQQTRPRGYDTLGRWDIRSRFEDFAATQAERVREKMRPTPDTDSLPVTVIPAPPRRGAALAQLLEEEELQTEASSGPAAPIPPAATTAFPSRPSVSPSPISGSLRQGGAPLPTSQPSGAPQHPVDDILGDSRGDSGRVERG